MMSIESNNPNLTVQGKTSLQFTQLCLFAEPELRKLLLCQHIAPQYVVGPPILHNCRSGIPGTRGLRHRGNTSPECVSHRIPIPAECPPR